ncbi:MAG TPA: SDR family NAD(P)-dependent oxidoreductase [Syntrophales bacterium]|nr:SDR family NAD(P)-dependent oxidoreductase [Syntrophales bacterium]HOL59156.1 SDR family NAD(P)-dependent oxidoreductase [Syntrophales bacterium]HPO35763.1 SDR family NAD(P)-dependent oxidoreductase [Syntrophales bacterium]
MEIKNRTAVVTGGASGLGAATVEVLARAGGKVIIADVQKERALELASRLKENVAFVFMDVTDGKSVSRGLEEGVTLFGGIHFLVNAAGAGWSERTVKKNGPHSLAVFEQVLKLNLVGTFNCASQAAFVMSKNEPDENGERGVIVNVASTAAFDGQIGQVAYAASKGGVVSMTLPMARDLAGLGIRCVTIAPGVFDTPLLAMLPAEMKQALSEMVPFPKRLGVPCEFAILVEHVIRNPYLNGEVIRLDGALRMPPK